MCNIAFGKDLWCHEKDIPLEEFPRVTEREKKCKGRRNTTTLQELLECFALSASVAVTEVTARVVEFPKGQLEEVAGRSGLSHRDWEGCVTRTRFGHGHCDCVFGGWKVLGCADSGCDFAHSECVGSGFACFEVEGCGVTRTCRCDNSQAFPKASTLFALFASLASIGLAALIALAALVGVTI